MSDPFKTIFGGVSISKKDWREIKTKLARAEELEAELSDLKANIARKVTEWNVRSESAVNQCVASFAELLDPEAWKLLPRLPGRFDVVVTVPEPTMNGGNANCSEDCWLRNQGLCRAGLNDPGNKFYPEPGFGCPRYHIADPGHWTQKELDSIRAKAARLYKSLHEEDKP